jgi:hypothetical protein
MTLCGPLRVFSKFFAVLDFIQSWVLKMLPHNINVTV